jgi:predicted phage terminase large subunit-like protein
MELNLGLIDDPHKGRAEAMSKVSRDKVWHWFTDDWMPRMHKNSGQLIVQTRWHPDDLIGRYKAAEPNLRIIHFPAIAEEDERFNLDDPNAITRHRGEALFPEVKPIEHLLERKRLMTQASWESEYQQNPIIVGGGIFPIDKLRVVPVFDRTKVRKSIRYVDKAGTKDGGAHTAMVLMSVLTDGRFLIEDVVRGQWSALEREETLLRVAQADRDSRKTPYEIVIEQEPGSGGKESAEATIRMLRGFRVFADKPGADRSKEIRAEPFAAQVQGSNVWLVAGRWINAFLEEAESWPNGKYKDQIDAAAGAFNRLTSKPMYNLDAFA